MRTAIVLCIALLAIGTLVPVAAAEPQGFGRCWLEEETVGYLLLPDGTEYPITVSHVECAW